jgi:hypothetical protein
MRWTRRRWKGAEKYPTNPEEDTDGAEEQQEVDEPEEAGTQAAEDEDAEAVEEDNRAEPAEKEPDEEEERPGPDPPSAGGQDSAAWFERFGVDPQMAEENAGPVGEDAEGPAEGD